MSRSLIQKNQILHEMIRIGRVQIYLNDIIDDSIVNRPRRWNELQDGCSADLLKYFKLRIMIGNISQHMLEFRLEVTTALIPLLCYGES